MDQSQSGLGREVREGEGSSSAKTQLQEEKLPFLLWNVLAGRWGTWSCRSQFSTGEVEEPEYFLRSNCIWAHRAPSETEQKDDFFACLWIQFGENTAVEVRVTWQRYSLRFILSVCVRGRERETEPTECWRHFDIIVFNNLCIILLISAWRVRRQWSTLPSLTL